MAKIDSFTSRRISRFVEEHRKRSGQLPTLQDFEKSQIPPTTVDQAVREGLLEQAYINLTSGPMVKGYRLKVHDIV